MKTVLITGASGNLGRALVKRFLSEGCRVVGTVTNKDAEVLKDKNSDFEKVVVDLMNEEASGSLVDLITSKYGRIDFAVLTVGGFTMGSLAETTTAEIYKQYKLNFETTYNIARPVFLQMMKQNDGRIFLIGSRAGASMHNSKGVAAYGLSKSLIFRLAELMNEEGKGHNVVTGVVVPSVIDTAQNRQSMPNADFNKWVKPEEIADVISFYSSQEAMLLREPVIKVYGNS